jgi:hypothetical protein
MHNQIKKMDHTGQVELRIIASTVPESDLGFAALRLPRIRRVLVEPVFALFLLFPLAALLLLFALFPSVAHLPLLFPV